MHGIILFQGGLEGQASLCAALPDGIPVIAVEENPQLPVAAATADPSASPTPAPSPTEAPCAKIRAWLSADDLRAGQIAGAAVGAWVKTNWSCTYDAYVSFESSTATARSRLRMDGYRQGFRTMCPATLTNEQLAQSADRLETGRDAIGELLGRLPDKHRILVVAVNDDGARGAVDGAKEAGRQADVFVSGQGADPWALDQVRNNDHYLGDSAYFPEKYGATAVPALLELIAGRSVPQQLLVEPQWVDKSTIGSIYPG